MGGKCQNNKGPRFDGAFYKKVSLNNFNPTVVRLILFFKIQ